MFCFLSPLLGRLKGQAVLLLALLELVDAELVFVMAQLPGLYRSQVSKVAVKKVQGKLTRMMIGHMLCSLASLFIILMSSKFPSGVQAWSSMRWLPSLLLQRK